MSGERLAFSGERTTTNAKAIIYVYKTLNDER